MGVSERKMERKAKKGKMFAAAKLNSALFVCASMSGFDIQFGLISPYKRRIFIIFILKLQLGGTASFIKVTETKIFSTLAEAG